MVIKLTKKEARELSNKRKGLFGYIAQNQKEYGSSYLGEAFGNTYIVLGE